MTKRFILSVDDDEVNQVVISSFLEGAGFSVACVYSGEECLKFLSKAFASNFKDDISHHLPDAILLDVLMPGMNGFEVCREIRLRFSVTIPVILLSARMTKDDVLHGLSYGLANDYLTKPFDRAILLAKLEARISLNKMTNAQTSLQSSTFLSTFFQRFERLSPGTPSVIVVFGGSVSHSNLSETLSKLSSSLLESGVRCSEMQAGMCILTSDSADVLLNFCCSIFGHVSTDPQSTVRNAVCFLSTTNPINSIITTSNHPDSIGCVLATRNFVSALSEDSLSEFFPSHSRISPRKKHPSNSLQPLDLLLDSLSSSDSSISFLFRNSIACLENLENKFKDPENESPTFLSPHEKTICESLLSQLDGSSTNNISSVTESLFKEFLSLQANLAETESGLEFERVNLDALRNRFESACKYKSELANQLDLVDDLSLKFISLE